MEGGCERGGEVARGLERGWGWSSSHECQEAEQGWVLRASLHGADEAACLTPLPALAVADAAGESGFAP